ncbi:hypothetical protein MKZ07_23110 [Paenibacillus sp. FSL P4-0338]|uniref:hypothetical protein n=1 Tax=unclassified Paenibacillus TaxID=185978 RepID=UPI0030F690B0
MSESFLVSAIKAFFPNSPLAMFYILISLVSIWMYKQFRAYLIENQKSTIGKTEKAIEVYSELEVTIRKILRENIVSTSLDECITKSSSYLPYELLKDYYYWVETEEEVEGDRIRKLKELHQKVKDEVLKLKRTQYDSVTYRNNGGMMEFIEVYYKTKLVSLFEPLFHTAINLLILLITVLVVGTIAVTDEWTQKVFLISILISGIFFLLVLDLILSEVLLKKRFKHSSKNWIIFGLFIIVPILLALWGQWYIGVIIIVIIIAYAYYAAKFSIRTVSGA